VQLYNLRQYSTRISPVVEPHPETLAELVTYGFSEADCINTLSTEKKKHPVVSLYYLIDDARLRRERRWKSECERIEKMNHAIRKQNSASLHQSRSPSPVHEEDTPIPAFRPIVESAATSQLDINSNVGSPSPDQRTILQYLMSRRSPVKQVVAA